MQVFVLFFTFLFGTAIGSFINAFEYRLHKGKDFITERSKCPDCGHVLTWKDLVPILSWIGLGGKCRYCSKPISVQYPLVEFTIGLLFALFAYLNYNSIISSSPYSFLSFLLGLIAISALVFFTIYDLKYGIIPDKVLLPLIGIWTIWRLYGFDSIFEYKFFNYLFSALGAGLFFLIIILITRGKGMGGGDFKLAIWLGLLLGWPQILFALYFSFIFGGIIGAILILAKKKKMKQTVPFGPFLAISTLLFVLYGVGLSEFANKYLFANLLW